MAIEVAARELVEFAPRPARWVDLDPLDVTVIRTVVEVALDLRRRSDRIVLPREHDQPVKRHPLSAHEKQRSSMSSCGAHPQRDRGRRLDELDAPEPGERRHVELRLPVVMMDQQRRVRITSPQRPRQPQHLLGVAV